MPTLLIDRCRADGEHRPVLVIFAISVLDSGLMRLSTIVIRFELQRRPEQSAVTECQPLVALICSETQEPLWLEASNAQPSPFAQQLIKVSHR